MRAWRAAFFVGLAPVAACEGSDPASPWLDRVPVDDRPDSSAAPDASPDATVDGGLPPPLGHTWSHLYARYFGGQSSADTPGHCGRAGCHGQLFHGFRCGSDVDTCYAGMVAAGLVDPQDPLRSRIARPDSPLVWFNPTGGIMPLDEPLPNPQAAADVVAWLQAGALDDHASDAGTEGGAEAGASDASGQ